MKWNKKKTNTCLRCTFQYNAGHVVKKNWHQCHWTGLWSVMLTTKLHWPLQCMTNCSPDIWDLSNLATQKTQMSNAIQSEQHSSVVTIPSGVGCSIITMSHYCYYATRHPQGHCQWHIVNFLCSTKLICIVHLTIKCIIYRLCK